ATHRLYEAPGNESRNSPFTAGSIDWPMAACTISTAPRTSGPHPPVECVNPDSPPWLLDAMQWQLLLPRDRYMINASQSPWDGCRKAAGNRPTTANPSESHSLTARSFVLTTKLNCIAR